MKRNPETINNAGNTSKESDVVLQNTNDEILETLFEKEMKESISYNIAQKVIELNPNVELKFGEENLTLYSPVEAENLILPEGFYYNKKNGITNKHNTKTGIYGSLHVDPIEYFEYFYPEEFEEVE